MKMAPGEKDNKQVLQNARIGIDVTAALTQGGGIGRYTRELVQALVIQETGANFRLFSARPPAALPVPQPLPQADNVDFFPTRLSERWLYRFWYRLRLPLPVQWKTGKLDLFHSPDFVLPPVNGRIPTLLTVHDLSFIHYPDTFPPALVNYLNQVVPWSVGRATHILADSRATKDDLLEFWRVSPEKVTVLYSGVNPDFKPATVEQETAVREKYNLGNTPYLLGVGTIQPRKNYQMLIQAFQPVAARFPHNLYIAGGKGWLYDEMMAEISRQGLDGRVRFIGFVADADLPMLYSGASLFLFPSIYEGFGLPLLEAMACGVPVVTSNVSSLPEVVGETAVQLSPFDKQVWTDAMLNLLLDPLEREKLTSDGFKRVTLFSWQRSANQLLKIYTDLLS